MANTTIRTGRRPVQAAALLVGVAFLAVGVLGFIPGATSGDLAFAGPHSHALLFGVFAVSALHNLVHLLFGVLGVLASARRGPSRMFLVVGGGLYLLLWVYGSIIHEGGPLPVNAADNWLHFGLGAAMVVLGVATTAVERSRGQYPGPEQRG
ncbi:hypothetical protein FHS29_003712 [Saccharothrix tamanrassetensis]|uniref:DUF4383 domain-containing protein n=1 Tax=Saccharothrix tamanrassetensis TaxID=1051531 RepID=A0A841CIJ4_9PSEU|nr:DUF4383 domain-containing protein [Saccharothrix tamanrassetensis]MBB5957119.1 hypothetical protein [Saccharothrix tamanrassetensis]